MRPSHRADEKDGFHDYCVGSTAVIMRLELTTISRCITLQRSPTYALLTCDCIIHPHAAEQGGDLLDAIISDGGSYSEALLLFIVRSAGPDHIRRDSLSIAGSAYQSPANETSEIDGHGIPFDV